MPQVVDVKVATKNKAPRKGAKKGKRRPGKRISSKPIVNVVRVAPKRNKRNKPRRKSLSPMQTTPVFGHRAAAFLQAIADPRNAAPIRLPEKTSTRKTAVANPFEFIRPSLIDSGYSDTNLWGILGRHPARQLIYRDANANLLNYSYNSVMAWADPSTGIVSSGVQFPMNIGSINLNEGFFLPITYAQGTSTYLPHGPRLYAGSVSKKPEARFLFINQSDALTFTLSAPTNADVNLELIYYLNGMLIYHQNKIASGSSSVSFGTIGEGYLAVFVQTAATNVTTQTISFTFAGGSTISVTGHKAMPGLENLLTGNVNLRMIGSSIRLQNNASELTGGSITACQLPGKVDWTTYVYNSLTVAAPSVPDLGGISEVHTLPFKKGFYTYVKIEQENDFEYHDDFVVRNGIITDSRYCIDKGNFVVYTGTGIGASGATVAQPMWIIERSSSIEFETTDITRAVDSSEDEYALLVEALAALRHAPQFLENPTHARAILAALKKYGMIALKGTIKYGPSVLSAAKMLAALAI